MALQIFKLLTFPVVICDITNFAIMHSGALLSHPVARSWLSRRGPPSGAAAEIAQCTTKAGRGAARPERRAAGRRRPARHAGGGAGSWSQAGGAMWRAPWWMVDVGGARSRGSARKLVGRRRTMPVRRAIAPWRAETWRHAVSEFRAPLARRALSAPRDSGKTNNERARRDGRQLGESTASLCTRRCTHHGPRTAREERPFPSLTDTKQSPAVRSDGPVVSAVVAVRAAPSHALSSRSLVSSWANNDETTTAGSKMRKRDRMARALARARRRGEGAFTAPRALRACVQRRAPCARVCAVSAAPACSSAANTTSSTAASRSAAARHLCSGRRCRASRRRRRRRAARA